MSGDLLDDNFVRHDDIKAYDFPLSLTFKIGTIANDFIAKDKDGVTLAYVRQKMFKFKEAIDIYTDESKSSVLFTIAADRVIDFNANYSFKDAEGTQLGRVGRRGMRSIFKATYEVFDAEGNLEFTIQEENPWAKFWDGLVGEIPFVGFVTGYIFNPKYIVKRASEEKVARLSKEPSLFGRHFNIEKLGELDAKDGEDRRVMLSLMMLSLLERRRG